MKVHELADGEDRDALEGDKAKKVTVAAHDVISPTGDGAFEDAVIVGISGDSLDVDVCADDFGVTVNAGANRGMSAEGILNLRPANV